jgi:hypothetical protein
VYPTWNRPGEEYGGREGLYKLHAGSHKHRAYTSMIHNFDDAYKNTRAWDDGIIARHGDGSLGRLWQCRHRANRRVWPARSKPNPVDYRRAAPRLFKNTGFPRERPQLQEKACESRGMS